MIDVGGGVMKKKVTLDWYPTLLVNHGLEKYIIRRRDGLNANPVQVGDTSEIQVVSENLPTDIPFAFRVSAKRIGNSASDDNQEFRLTGPTSVVRNRGFVCAYRG